MILTQFGAGFRALGWVLGGGAAWQDPVSPHLKGLPSSPLPIILPAPWPQGSLSEADLASPGRPCSLTPSMDTQMLAYLAWREVHGPCLDFTCRGE